MQNLARGIAGISLLAVSACGGDHHHDVFVANIPSVQSADGDVAFDSTTGVFTVSSATANQDVLYGLDATVSSLPEYRAFLDFPLDGSSGGGIVPSGARVRSSTLELFVLSTDFASTIPSLIELVPYPTTGPRDTDYDSVAISALAVNVFASDAGSFLDMDVGPLVVDALGQGLVDVQLRLGLDPSANQGLVQIADGVPRQAPVLAVEYD
jgi:hypothetical protein